MAKDLDRIKEQTRLRVKRYRERKAQVALDVTPKSNQNVTQLPTQRLPIIYDVDKGLTQDNVTEGTDYEKLKEMQRVWELVKRADFQEDAELKGISIIYGDGK